MDFVSSSLDLHQRNLGKIEVISKVPLTTREDLSLAYTPGVAEPCRRIAENKEAVYEYTSKGNLVAVVTDGSAVLGLGNIGPEAAMPVMEGKAILFKQFAGLDAFPICLGTQDTEEIIRIVKTLEPTFGGINLEDIAAPRCFEIEERLKKEMKIPVFHDDQHGTAVVVLAGLLNALPLAGKRIDSAKIVISGAGAAGTAIAKLLCKCVRNGGIRPSVIPTDSRAHLWGGAEESLNPYEKGFLGSPAKAGLSRNDKRSTVPSPTNGETNGALRHGPNIIVCDSHGALSSERQDLNPEKQALRKLTNPLDEKGLLRKVLKNADVFIGVSAPNLLSAADIKNMAEKPIVFAMANPEPEIMPEEARAGGAFIVATGRSDYPNQLNNVLVFPGMLKGAMKARCQITEDMELNAARALAAMVQKPSVEKIIPSVFEEGVAERVADAVINN